MEFIKALSEFTNRANPDQTASEVAVRSGSALFV